MVAGSLPLTMSWLARRYCTGMMVLRLWGPRLRVTPSTPYRICRFPAVDEWLGAPGVHAPLLKLLKEHIRVGSPVVALVLMWNTLAMRSVPSKASGTVPPEQLIMVLVGWGAAVECRQIGNCTMSRSLPLIPLLGWHGGGPRGQALCVLGVQSL